MIWKIKEANGEMKYLKKNFIDLHERFDELLFTYCGELTKNIQTPKNDMNLYHKLRGISDELRNLSSEIKDENLIIESAQC